MKLIPVLFSFGIMWLPFSQDRKQFLRLHALEGTWVKPGGASGDLYEEWVKLNDHNLQGRVYRIINGDTVVSEKASLMRKQQQIVFVATVIQENDQQPIPFFLVSNEKKLFVFENLTHDFPKRVAYELVSNDSLHAWVDGGEKDTSKRVEYGYKRKR
jgi:hypothetical protein